MTKSFLEEMRDRHLIAQISDHDGLSHHLAEEVRTAYVGFDPTAPSLHIGNLVPLLALRRFQHAGHRPIVLVGGATGLIGDPSGRLDERQLNEVDTVAEWVGRLKHQVSRFIEFEGENAGLVVDNLEWTRDLDAISFLRDMGKHFSVNAMIQRDSVKARLDRDNEGISYTEFSYVLLQAMDFLELRRRYDCAIQFGGSDQWGNMVSGIELIRRIDNASTYVMTLPLIAKKDGSKYGKTASGSVWLDPELTSPYSFYQFWINAADDDVPGFLKYFTECTNNEYDEIVKSSEAAPEKRVGQTYIAEYLTRLVHDQDGLRSAKRITDALFEGSIDSLTESDFAQLQQDGLDYVTAKSNQPIVETIVDLGFAPSRGKARTLLNSGGVANNAVIVDSHLASVDNVPARFGKYHLLRRGRKKWGLVVQSDT